MRNKMMKSGGIFLLTFMIVLFSTMFVEKTVRASTIDHMITLFVGESWSVEMNNSDNYIGTVNGTKKGNKYEKEYATATISGKKLTVKATKGNGNYNTFYIYKKSGALARTVKVYVRTKPTITSITNTTSTKSKSSNVYLYIGNSSKVTMNTGGTVTQSLWTFAKITGANSDGITLSNATSKNVTIKGVTAGTYTLTAKVSAMSSKGNCVATKNVTVYVYTKPNINVLQNDIPVTSLILSKGASQPLSVQKQNIGNGIKDSVSFTVPSQYSSFISTSGISSSTGFFTVTTKSAFPKGTISVFYVNWTIISGDAVSNNNGAQTFTKSISVKLSDYTIIQKLSFDKSNYAYYVGDTFRIYPIIVPANTKVNENFTWSSSDRNIATVDSNGNVLCKGTGMATINVQATDGSDKKASYKVVVGAAVPTGLKSSTTSKGIKLTWNTMTGISRYQVYRSTKLDGIYENLGKVSNLSFTDEKIIPKTTYFYKIVAIPEAGSTYQSQFSCVVCAKFTLKKPKIKSVKSSSGSKKIKISGTKYTGFIVYYGKSKKTKTVRADVSGKTASIYIPAKNKKQKLYIRVRAYKKIGTKYYYSEYSKSKKIIIKAKKK